MITLYHFGPFHGLADPSPFCLKVDLYLRVAGLEFKTDPGVHHLRNAPKGKLPYIDDEGKTIGDSMFIFDHFKDKYGDTLDKELDTEQRAITRAFIKMMDENLYWCMVHSRWMNEDMWPIIRQEFFGKMPFPLKYIVPVVARKGVAKSLSLHGLGRHSDQEILDIARQDITALSDYLGTKEYFLLDKSTTLDVTAFAFLAQMIVPDLHCELNNVARSFKNLVDFVNRIKKQYYPD